jgi:flagellin-like protein
MKANRKFVDGNEEGVSAVIGVILMVAITVAIAATVYVYVSGMIGGNVESGPSISWNADLSQLELLITKGSAGDAYGATATNPNLIFKCDSNSTNAHVSGTTTLVLTYGDATAATLTDISAGDIITNFADGESYTIIWEPTDEVVGKITF